MTYAHSINAEGKRHELVEHSRAVAKLAMEFAEPFGAGELAYYAGLWHDLGKFHPDFQAYLRQCEEPRGAPARGPDHKAAGAKFALRCLGTTAMVIQGHHGGLRSKSAFEQWLGDREGEARAGVALERARKSIGELMPDAPITMPPYIGSNRKAGEFFLRMLFSAMVDADFLDTESHFHGERAALRGLYVPLEALWERFRDAQGRLSGGAQDAVGRVRHEVYESCLAAAEREPGIFRLTAPTGGGKTRSAMGFALKHAMRHGMERVVVAVPFLTITEQTADVYRDIFDRVEGTPAVLENHSAADWRDDDEGDFHSSASASRLAAENWDARIVVTTTVQLFESLFSNRVGRARKLHNLARAVIILDEAQSLPPHLLTPILDALRELVDHYGCSVVLSTATQPAFESIGVFAEAKAVEIVPDFAQHFKALRRVDYEWRIDRPLAWAEVAEELKGRRQALVIVNTKKDAIDLLGAMRDEDALHLSTMLCGRHRRDTIEEVKRRLGASEPCRVVSTQVVEAGVDLDFPVVFRAMGPLDGIIQAAGRCNREARLDGKGEVVVFRSDGDRVPPGTYRMATKQTRAVVRSGRENPDDPNLSREYFKQLFALVESDREGVQPSREALDYPEVARKFRMIDDDSQSIVITVYGSEEERQVVLDALRRLKSGTGNPRLLMRTLQPYLVSARTDELSRLKSKGLVSEVIEGVWEWMGRYDPVRGIGGVDGIDPEFLIV